jgi:hypothetical protein
VRQDLYMRLHYRPSSLTRVHNKLRGPTIALTLYKCSKLPTFALTWRYPLLPQFHDQAISWNVPTTRHQRRHHLPPLRPHVRKILSNAVSCWPSRLNPLVLAFSFSSPTSSCAARTALRTSSFGHHFPSAGAGPRHTFF